MGEQCSRATGQGLHFLSIKDTILRPRLISVARLGILDHEGMEWVEARHGAVGGLEREWRKRCARRFLSPDVEVQDEEEVEAEWEKEEEELGSPSPSPECHPD